MVTKRVLKEPEGSFFLFGPRGTGKSTWLQTTLPNALRVDLLDPASQRQFQARPERLRELVAGQPGVCDVVIDEIQKAPTLLDVIHQMVEADRSLRFILTGSSARKLRRGSANLLAGRLVQAEMHPFMAAELGAEFALFHRLINDASSEIARERLWLPNPSDMFEGENSFDIYRLGLVGENDEVI